MGRYFVLGSSKQSPAAGKAWGPGVQRMGSPQTLLNKAHTTQQLG